MYIRILVPREYERSKRPSVKIFKPTVKNSNLKAMGIYRKGRVDGADGGGKKCALYFFGGYFWKK
jgi:hypothetical protein